MISYSRIGSELTVNSTYARSQAHAEVAVLAGGRFAVTWLDADFNTTAGRYVRLQVYEADGTPSGGELTVAGPLNGATQPTVTGLIGGGYVVSWDSSSGTKAQVYDSSSVAVGGVVTLVANWGGNHADVAALADGGFAVAWHDDRSVGGDVSGSGVHLRTFDATGAATSADVLVNSTTGGDQHMVSVAVLAGGNRVVTWFDDAVGPNPNAVRAQIFDSAGAPVGSEIMVNVGSGIFEGRAPVTALANGNFAVAWFQYDATLGSAHRLQIFAPTGERVGGEIAVVGSSSGSETGPALAALDDGSLAVAWLGYDGAGSSGRGVFVQVFDAGGTALGDPLQVNTQASGDQLDPSITAIGDGGFVVTWTDLNGAGADDDQVMAQVFGRSGTVEPVAISSNGGGDTAAITVTETALVAAHIEASGGLGPLTYAIAGGADAALFSIDAATGALHFAAAPDFEAPADADGDNIYEVIVSAGDGVRTDTQTLSILAENLNEAPAIVSNGGGASVVLAVEEGTLAVTTVAAEDGDSGALTYSITGGADAALFTIAALTGELNFVTAPDFTMPADEGGDNVYDVTVSATDGDLSAYQALSIVVQQLPLAFAETQFEQWENYPEALALELTHAATGEPTVFTVTGGADAALFQLSEDGLIWLAPQDYEAPADGDANNSYEIEVTAHQGARATAATLTFTMHDVNEAPWLVGGTDWTVDENVEYVGTLAAVDPEGDELRWFVSGGADGHLFTVDRYTGEFGFLAAPDFELAGDADSDNVYELEVGVIDGQLVGTQTISVSVLDAPDSFDFVDTAFVAPENGLFAAALSVDAAVPAAYAITGGSDAALFALDAASGELSFLSAPDFEAWGDTDGDNVFEVKVTATAGSAATTETIFVTVDNVDEAPIITSGGGAPSVTYQIAENTTAVAIIAAQDPDGDPVSFSLAGGVDAARFAINPANGALSFIAAPDFEAPADSNHDNRYVVVVSAGNGPLEDLQMVTVQVGNVGGLTLTGTSAADVLAGSAEADTLSGLAGNDTLNGGDGSDRLTGGSGADLLTGGLKDDDFVFTAVNESTLGASDRILDFSRSQGDKIDVSAIDARVQAGGNQAFSFIGSAAFSGSAGGQLRYFQQGGDTIVQGDVNGDRIADFQIIIDLPTTLFASDFIL